MPFVFVSGEPGEDAAVEALKSGASDYVLKARLERLAPAARRALAEAGAREERRRAEAALRDLNLRLEQLAGQRGRELDASRAQMQAFFDNLVRELDKVEFLRPVEKRETMLVNLRNIFTRMDPTKQDMHTLHGVVMAIAEGRKGSAKGGVLDGAQATRLRALLAEHGQGGDDSSGTVRGLA
ncbi:MAG: hypothetical protein ABR562_09770, partial [Thermoplasmatota archaeon]